MLRGNGGGIGSEMQGHGVCTTSLVEADMFFWSCWQGEYTRWAPLRAAWTEAVVRAALRRRSAAATSTTTASAEPVDDGTIDAGLRRSTRTKLHAWARGLPVSVRLAGLLHVLWRVDP